MDMKTRRAAEIKFVQACLANNGCAIQEAEEILFLGDRSSAARLDAVDRYRPAGQPSWRTGFGGRGQGIIEKDIQAGADERLTHLSPEEAAVLYVTINLRHYGGVPGQTITNRFAAYNQTVAAFKATLLGHACAGPRCTEGMPENRMRPIPPGEILREEYKFTPETFAERMGVTAEVARDVLKGTAPITEELAATLGQVLETTPVFWLNMQEAFERRCAALGFNLDPVKFREMTIHIVAGLQDNDPKDVRLMATMFFADFEAYRDLGKSLTGAPYERFHDMLRPGPTARAAAVVLLRDGTLYPDNGRLHPRRPADLSGFTAEELALLERVRGEIAGQSVDQIRARIQELDGWRLTADREIIPYFTALLPNGDVEPSEEALRYGREVVAPLLTEPLV